VSGKSFNDFCQERLFKPLGMARTHALDFTEVVDRATAYRGAEQPVQDQRVVHRRRRQQAALTSELADLNGAWTPRAGNPWVRKPDAGQRNGRFVIEIAKVECGGLPRRPRSQPGGSTAGFWIHARWPDSGCRWA
jgi:CubicO group peptidase (beta-lactamase class C family)